MEKKTYFTTQETALFSWYAHAQVWYSVRMKDPSKRVRKATLMLIGTIIGAGLFGLPALFAGVGFWPGTMMFWFVACIVLLTHLYYAEIILHFKKRMRLVGYADTVLGTWGRVVMGISYPLQTIGVNLIYIILGGAFLAALLKGMGIGGPLWGWQLVFWGVGVLVVTLGLSFLAKVESVATWLLIGSIVVCIVLAAGRWEMMLLPAAHWDRLFIPFGIFLFSLSGINVIPELVEVTGRKPDDTRRAIVFGTLGAALLSWFFGIGLYLASGGQIGHEPTDLLLILPPVWSWLIPLVGLLAIITSYVTTADDLKETFRLDFHLPEWLAVVFAMGLPLALFGLQRDFFTTIDFVGTIFGGLNCLF
ncbi:MAG: aromatic amino acid transport family protein, partial [bacterium]|nr:aromatic amino acid transport family protein [bacterium]